MCSSARSRQDVSLAHHRATTQPWRAWGAGCPGLQRTATLTSRGIMKTADTDLSAPEKRDSNGDPRSNIPPCRAVPLDLGEDGMSGRRYPWRVGLSLHSPRSGGPRSDRLPERRAEPADGPACGACRRHRTVKLIVRVDAAGLRWQQCAKSRATTTLQRWASAATCLARERIAFAGSAPRGLHGAGVLARAAGGLTRPSASSAAAEGAYGQLVALTDGDAAYLDAHDDVRRRLSEHDEVVGACWRGSSRRRPPPIAPC